MIDKDLSLVVSPENLVHFQCPHCKGWWSIGDAPKREHWFCPWCGEKSLTKEEDWEYTYPEILEEYFPEYIPDIGEIAEPMVQVWSPDESRWVWTELRDSQESGSPFRCGT